MKRFAIALIHLYQRAVSPFQPVSCRYLPTCSRYACEAVERHGVWRGGWLTLKRLARCTPFTRCGYDPVP